MALIGTPPQSGGVGSVNQIVNATAIGQAFGHWQPIEPFIGPVLLANSSISGAEIVAAGQYEVTFNFSCQVTNTTTSIQLRLNASGADGAYVAKDFSHADASGIIDGTLKEFANVTISDIAANQVFLLIEGAALAGTEDVTWVHSELSIRRIGAAI